jgi:phage terminase small subunit
MANTKRGPRRTSLAEKKASGSYRADRNGQGPVQLPKVPPKKPRVWKNKVASRFWDDTIPKLYAAGVVCEIDTAEAIALCESYAMWRRAVEDEGKILDIKRAYDMFASISKRFGMTPIDRQKLTEHESPEADPFQAYFQDRVNGIAEG